MNVAIVCTGVLGLLLFGLGLHVSLLRRRTRRSIGCDTGPTDPLHRAVRAHGNTAEYAPFFAVLFLWFAVHPGPAWVTVAIVLATLARVALVAGLLFGPSLDKPTPARFVGALLTYVTGIALALRLALG
ncbi:MAG TPA: MAPEG family protein [Bradyrhizobium sp.]|nr:MAPEG family protein [Bradyrhizobium sp.]